jgi:hypothetical protein|tara:strand:- start:575 stop:1234 length:660 start_codon:yes stop_codon:yes gene_type:complete
MGQMTRLAAVNQMLLAAGEAIVSDLENQSGVDTSIAEYLLDEYTDDFQLRGLANNMYSKVLTVGVDGLVHLPQTIISLNFETLLVNEDLVTVKVSVKKQAGGFILWNVTDQTSDFSAYSDNTLKAQILDQLPWEDIDTPGQRAIVASAARRYQMLTQGDEGMDAYLQQDEMIYQSMGKSRDIESRHRTIWDAADYQTKRAVYRPNGGNPNVRLWRGRMS